MADGAVVIDCDGIIEYVNLETENLFQYSTEEMVRSNVGMLMGAQDRADYGGHITRCLATGNTKILGISREELGRRKDGVTFPLDLTVSKSEVNSGRFSWVR